MSLSGMHKMLSEFNAEKAVILIKEARVRDHDVTYDNMLTRVLEGLYDAAYSGRAGVSFVSLYQNAAPEGFSLLDAERQAIVDRLLAELARRGFAMEYKYDLLIVRLIAEAR